MQDQQTKESDLKQSFYFMPQAREFARVFMIGLIVLLISFGLAKLFSQYVLVPLVCKQSGSGICATPFTFSFNSFLILGQLVTLIWFAKQQIFRPALVVIPAAVVTWSLPVVIASLYIANPLLFIALAAAIVALINTAFYWLVRLRSFFATLVLWLVLILLLRWLIVS